MRYVVTSVRETGTITYYCPTEVSAQKKVQDFRHAEYSEIKVYWDEADPGSLGGAPSLDAVEEPGVTAAGREPPSACRSAAGLSAEGA